MEESLKIAKNIVSKGPLAIKKVKSVVRKGLEMSQTEGEELEAKQFGELFGKGSEGEKGMTAFLEKRKPEW
jgi:enoyl-CoA hydratase/carnithine racemase